MSRESKLAEDSHILPSSFKFYLYLVYIANCVCVITLVCALICTVPALNYALKVGSWKQ